MLNENPSNSFLLQFSVILLGAGVDVGADVSFVSILW